MRLKLPWKPLKKNSFLHRDLVKTETTNKTHKKTTMIKSSDFMHKTYLDTEEDVMVFIEKVKSELLNAIKDDLRIRIR